MAGINDDDRTGRDDALFTRPIETVAAGDRTQRKAAYRVLEAEPARSCQALIAAVGQAKSDAVRGRLIRCLAFIGARCSVLPALEFLLPLTSDRDPSVQRAAIAALSHVSSDVHDLLGGAEALEQRLLALLRPQPTATLRDDVTRALVEALGHVGGDSSATALAALNCSEPLLAEARDKARLMLARRPLAGPTPAAASSIDAWRAFERPVALRAWCRAGLEALLVEELGPACAPKIISSGRVALRSTESLGALLRARTLLCIGIDLPPAPLADASDETLAQTFAAMLNDERTLALVTRLTRGPLTYRIAFNTAGKRRALVWKLAQATAARPTPWVNSPRQACWEVNVTCGVRRLYLELIARVLDDPRFSYRVALTPAASHPTIAAALARVAAPRPGEVIWDPFVGCGTELIECAQLEKDVRLLGTDQDPAALTAARQNLGAAKLDAQLETADALSHLVPDATLVITNPPYGRRTGPAAASALERFLAGTAPKLRPGARIVAIAPDAARCAAAARSAGLALTRSLRVDLGGFFLELHRYDSAR